MTFNEAILSLLHYNEKMPLLFNSGIFLILFVFFLAIFMLVEKKQFLRVTWTLAFSLFFYYKSSGNYVLILLISTLIDYTLGWMIFTAPSKAIKRVFLFLSLFANLGMLAYFKYTNFFIDTFNSLGASISSYEIFLPIGISFYTFQTLSYSIDIYRGELKPTQNILDFAFFVSFFPQLVAGPIVRAADFLPQINKKIAVSNADLTRATILIASGLFKKAVISDYISTNYVDRIFDNPALYSGFENLMGMYAYTLQIYCDFSGYSDMAIGLALLMGFTLMENFNAPYISKSITEFWRRWHISLSSWLKDYLYISMGGNRKSKIRTYFNLFITMLLGGLLHGASWKFVFWGMMHGTALTAERFFKDRIKLPKTKWIAAFSMLLTFHFIAFCWIFFRASDFSNALAVIKQISKGFNISVALEVVAAYRWVFLLISIGFLMHFIPGTFHTYIEQRLERTPLLFKSFIITSVAWLAFQVNSGKIIPFIYFQF